MVKEGGKPTEGRWMVVIGRALMDWTGVWPTTSVQPRVATGSMGEQ